MKIINILLNAYILWFFAGAFYKSKKNETSYVEELKKNCTTTIEYIRHVIKSLTSMKNSEINQKDAESNMDVDIIAQMYEDAKRLNNQVHEHVECKFPANHGWRYETQNYQYAITHKLPVIITICLSTRRMAYAEVIIRNGVVCDIVSIKPGVITETAHVVDFVYSASDFEDKADASFKTSTETPLSNTAADKASGDSEIEGDDIKDPQEAEAIAINYISDVGYILNDLANETVANGKTEFTFTPDIEGGKLVIEQIARAIKKLNFKEVTVSGKNIVIQINLDVPVDDEEDDFQEMKLDKEGTETPKDKVSFGEDAKIIIPEEPKDLP